MNTTPFTPSERGVEGHPPRISELMKRYGLSPKKSLGQNFLAASGLLQKIVDAADLTDSLSVIEVGAGLGTLTYFLTQAAGRVVAVEIDEQLCQVLKAEMGTITNLQIVQGDILKLRPADLLAGEGGGDSISPYVVVANLPYYITSNAIRWLLESTPPPVRLVLMLQAEVASRIVAGPGDASLLAMSVQFYGKPRIVTRVPAAAFIPPPRVDSAVIRIDVFDSPPVDVPNTRAFFRVVKAGFGQKRKQIKNSLAANLSMPAGQVVDILQEAGIDPRRRAQTLTLGEWAALVNGLWPKMSPNSLDKQNTCAYD